MIENFLCFGPLCLSMGRANCSLAPTGRKARLAAKLRR